LTVQILSVQVLWVYVFTGNRTNFHYPFGGILKTVNKFIATIPKSTNFNKKIN